MREKPLCGQCGERHWRFVACEQAEQKNAEEFASRLAREQAVERAKVYPLFQGGNRDARGQIALSNFEQLAPGVFVRKQRPPGAA